MRRYLADVVLWILLRIVMRWLPPERAWMLLRVADLLRSPTFDFAKQAILDSQTLIPGAGPVSWHWIQQSAHVYYPEAVNNVRRMEAAIRVETRLRHYGFHSDTHTANLLVELAYLLRKER